MTEHQEITLKDEERQPCEVWTRVMALFAALEPYRQMAADFGADIQVIEVAGPWPDRHNVAPEDRARMIDTWESWPRGEE